jgi:hypothetical protein
LVAACPTFLIFSSVDRMRPRHQIIANSLRSQIRDPHRQKTVSTKKSGERQQFLDKVSGRDKPYGARKTKLEEAEPFVMPERLTERPTVTVGVAEPSCSDTATISLMPARCTEIGGRLVLVYYIDSTRGTVP